MVHTVGLKEYDRSVLRLSRPSIVESGLFQKPPFLRLILASSYKELGNFGGVFQENREETTFKIIYLPCSVILGTLYPHVL